MIQLISITDKPNKSDIFSSCILQTCMYILTVTLYSALPWSVYNCGIAVLGLIFRFV